jgi:hypothetical protein
MVGWDMAKDVFDADLDQEAVLASIDGRRSLEAIAERTGLEPSAVLRVARALVEEGLVVLTWTGSSPGRMVRVGLHS